MPPEDLSTTEHGGVSILKERRVVRIDPTNKKAFLEDGTEISYSKCLLATGRCSFALLVWYKLQEVVQRV